jgi:hypothetical protein
MDSDLGRMWALDTTQRGKPSWLTGVERSINVPAVEARVAGIEVVYRKSVGVEMVSEPACDLYVLQTVMVLTLKALANETNILCARNSIYITSCLDIWFSETAQSWRSRSAYRKNTALCSKGFHVAMRVYLWCLGVESSDEFPLLDRGKMFLALDYDNFVCPYCIPQSVYVLIFCLRQSVVHAFDESQRLTADIVQIKSSEYCAIVVLVFWRLLDWGDLKTLLRKKLAW